MAKSLGSLNVGDKVEVSVLSDNQSRFGSKIVFKVADKNHSGYPTNSVTLITEKIIQIMNTDAKEPNNGDSNRKSYGNNRHIYSNILQWLNSNAEPGKWYSPKHSADAPPTSGTTINGNVEYSGWAGFLAMIDQKFVEELLETTLTVAKALIDGGSYETFKAKMFIASTTEVGLAKENGISEGSLLAMFSSDESRGTYPTAECVSNSEYNDVGLSPSKKWSWWARTPETAETHRTKIIKGSGMLDGDKSNDGRIGIRPLCNLKSSILVSDSPNTSGNYEIVYNKAPTTPTTCIAPKTCCTGSQIEINWTESTDPEGDSITYSVERSINGAAFAQMTTTADCHCTEAKVGETWDTVQYRVRAFDGHSYSGYATSGVATVVEVGQPGAVTVPKTPGKTITVRVKATDSSGNESAYATGETKTILYNEPPKISGQNEDLGVKSDGTTYKYTVTDEEQNAVTVTEAVDGKVLRTYAVVLGVENTMHIAGDDFTALSMGQHTATIKAEDTAGNITTRTLTFTKKSNGFVITLEEPMQSETMPVRCAVNISREIPFDALFVVEATNNPFDIEPTWEDITNEVKTGHTHVFTNKVNLAGQHGLNIRVTAQRTSERGECWVNGIGGNFE